MKKIKNIFIIFLILQLALTPLYADPWVFTAWGDPHRELADLSGNHPSGTPAAPGYLTDTLGLNGITAEMQQMIDDEVAVLQSFNPEAIVIMGDVGSGHFDTATIRNVFAPGGSYDDSIYNAGLTYWKQFRYWFTSGGFSNVLVAVGDHEVGDNPWPVGSLAARSVDQFKRTFTEVFNKNDEGQYFVTDLINGVNPRPVGTAYEGTSYAKQIRNVLFVTLDIFRQDDPNTELEPREGTVVGDVAGAHLEWLDAILTAADNDPSIEHIIIQGHNPTISPVRKKSSSGGMMHHREDGIWWQRVRQSDKVRAYLAGEVHEETATKDPGSDILQIVTKDFLVVTVDNHTLQFEHYEFKEQIDPEPKYWIKGQQKSGGGQLLGYNHRGSILADYSGSTAKFISSGRLKIINPKALAINYSFDETNSASAHNSGMMEDWLYNGENFSVVTTAGILNNAARFTGNGLVKTKGIFHGGRESRTFAAWIKTTSAARMNIMSHGKSDASFPGAFNVEIEDGILGVRIDGDGSSIRDLAQASGSPQINDGNWHHVTVVVKGRDALSELRNIQFFVDGVEYVSTSTSDIRIYTHPGNNAFYVASGANGTGPKFTGDIDDVAAWATHLTAAKVKALHNAVVAGLSYNAAIMETLYNLFDGGGAGELCIGSETWSVVSGLSGAAGDVFKNGNQYSIVLDDNGGGVSAISAIKGTKTDVIIGWDTGSLGAPSKPYSGITASLSGAMANYGTGSTDGTWGSLLFALSPNTTENASISYKTLNAQNTLTLNFVNNTGADVTLKSLHFDYNRCWSKSPKDIAVEYTSGDLDSGATTMLNAQNVTRGYKNYDITLSDYLSDTVLENGKSVNFTITALDGEETYRSDIDNIMLLFDVVELLHPEELIIGWDEGVTEKPNKEVNGVSVTLTGGFYRAGSEGSIDGTWGSQILSPSPSIENGTALSVKSNDSDDLLTITVVNNTGVDVQILDILFDYNRIWPTSPADISVSYLSGDLWNNPVSLLTLNDVDIGGYKNYEATVSGILQYGETAIFTIHFTGANRSVRGDIDNIAVRMVTIP